MSKREQRKKEFRLLNEFNKMLEKRIRRKAALNRPRGETIDYKGEVPHKQGRRFLGKTEGFIDKQEQKFENRHLKAYKRGEEYFIYGRDVERNPVYHNTKQELFYIN